MKKLMTTLSIIMIISVVFTSAFAAFAATEPTYDENLVPDIIKKEAKGVWGTMIVVVQIAAVACVVFAGLRYMFASADQKADIKKGLIYLSIGAVLVFGATLVLQFVVKVGNETLTP